MRNAIGIILLSLLGLSVPVFGFAGAGVDFYVSQAGNDFWSGRLAAPNAHRAPWQDS